MGRARRWGDPGGILELVGLIDDHPAALAYDWRTRFGCSVDDIGSGRPGAMTWGEATRLVRVLASDQSSWLCAALNRWPHPWSHELEVAASHWDLAAKVASKARSKVPTYPRPWARNDAPRRTERPALPQLDVRAALNRMRAGQVEQDGEAEDF